VPPHVFIALRLSKWEKEIVEEVLGSLAEIDYLKDPPDPYRGIEVAEAVIAFRLPNEAIEKARKLKFVQSPAAGVNGLNLELLTRRGITVASSKGCNARAVAEHAIALVLALAKRIVEEDRELKRGMWKRHAEEYMLLDLEGKTIGIIGYGHIGKEIARIAKALNMRVLAIKKNPLPKDPYADFVGRRKDLLKVLSQADFVILCLPLPAETRGLIGEKKLKAMKKTAYLINVGRGPVVDEEALYKALTQGWIAGAGIDVWWVYPPSEGAPSTKKIHELPNVIATSHKAGWTRKSRERCLRFAAENVARYLRGEKPLNIVNPRIGY